MNAEKVKFDAMVNLPNALLEILRGISTILTSPAVIAAASVLFIIIYYPCFKMLVGATPGKAISGVRVIGLQGRPLTFSRDLIRIPGYIPSTVVIFAGFLWFIIDNRRQAWHDKLARTCVLYAWDARLDERFLAVPIRHMNVLPGAEADELKD